MKLQMTIVASSGVAETKWAQDLTLSLGKQEDLQVQCYSEKREFGHIVFIDSKMPGYADLLQRMDRKGKAVFLIIQDMDSVPADLINGLVDDVLVHPFRRVEILSKLRYFQQIGMWDEVTRLNSTFAELLSQLQQDLQLAERLQKSKLPVRFPDIKGLKILSRYLAGAKSGGDHLDFAESSDQSQVSIVLTDSSTYGLSGNVLTVLMKVALKLSSDQTRSSLETVRKIYDELMLTLSPKDKLSIFYGVLNRKDYQLSYVNFGTSKGYLSKKGREFAPLETQAKALEKIDPSFPAVKELKTHLEPGDRLLLLSDGFIDVLGGLERAPDKLDLLREKEPADIMNDLVFKIKSQFQDPDDLPAQDCTAVLVDIDAKIIRLAKT